MSLYEQANLKVITFVQKYKITWVFYDDDVGYYLIFLIIRHFICLFWPVVQSRHNFNSPLCTCEGKYCFLNLFLFVCLFVFCNVITSLVGVL